jgi:hypothetical protein
MLRGGSVYDYYWYDVRAAVRVTSRVLWHDFNLGFRYAATIES